LIATLNGVALGGLTAANFATYLTPVAATSTVSNTGQTINLTGTKNTVLSTANTAGQFLTAGADTINVGVGTLPTAAASETSGLTLIDPGTNDADVMNVTNLAAGTFSGGGIVVSGIETINANMLVPNTTFSAAAVTPGTTTFGLTGTQNFVVTALPAGFGLTLGSGYTGQGSVQPISDTGAADTMTLNLAGSTATSDAVGASAIYVANGGATETATVNVSADSSIRLAGTGLLGTVAEVTAVNLTGSGALTVFGSAANLGTAALNGSGVGYTGALTLRPTSNANMDFSASGAITGIRTIDLRDAGTFGSTITLAAANNSAAYGSGAVTVSSNVNIGALNVTQLGSGLTDALVVTQSLAAGTVTSITTPGIETLTINLGGTSGGTTAKTTSIAMDISGATQALTVTSAVPVVLTAVTADSLNTTGVLGSLTAAFNVLSLGGSSFTGSTTQASFVTGTGFADVITTGSGNDAIYEPAGGNAANAAILNGGLGNDTYSLLSTTSGGTLITDTGGTDTLVLTGATANISGMNNGASLTTIGIDVLVTNGAGAVTVGTNQIGAQTINTITGSAPSTPAFTLAATGVLSVASATLTAAAVGALNADGTAITQTLAPIGFILTGSTAADTITGSALGDSISVVAGSGAYNAASGNDTYFAATTVGTMVITDTAGTDSLVFSGASANTETLGGTTFALMGIEQIIQPAAARVLTVKPGQIAGAALAVNIANGAGGGVESITLGSSGVLNASLVTGAQGTSYVPAAGGAVLAPVAVTGFTLTGFTGIDNITGSNAVATTVIGGQGADVLSGGTGATDTVSYSDVTGATIHGASNVTGVAINLTAAAITSATIGTAMTSVLGGAAAGAGDAANLAAGGAGYLVATANNEIVNLIIRDALGGFERVIGSPLADYIAGPATAATIDGGAGVDFILGGAGIDVITGGSGKDTLAGGASADTFVYTTAADSNGVTAASIDVITDLVVNGAAGDLLDFTLTGVLTVATKTVTAANFAAMDTTNEITVLFNSTDGNAVDAAAAAVRFTGGGAATALLITDAAGTKLLVVDVDGNGAFTVADVAIVVTGITVTSFTAAVFV